MLSSFCRFAGGSFFGALGFQELGGAFVELFGDPLGFGAALIRMALDWGYLDARAKLVPLAVG